MTFYTQELSNIGKIITFGSLNISLTLRLETSDIQSLGLNIKKINSLNDLSFILENNNLWDRFELSTESELLNTLIHMNRIKKIKNIVAYLVYDKINFNEEQIQFQRLLDFILLANGVVIYSYEICKCKISIYINIIYKNTTKKIVLYEEDNLYKNKIDNIDNNTSYNSSSEEKKEENEKEFIFEKGKDNIGLFGNIPENQVNFKDFKYIYIHLGDYIRGGEFYEIFKLNELYHFLKRIKINSKIKIIINFGYNLKKFEKYLIPFMKISDFHIFRNKNELFDILMKKKETDDINKLKSKHKFIQAFMAKKIHKMKKNKSLIKRNESKNSSNSNISLNKLNKISDDNNSNGYYTNRKIENKSPNLKSLLMKKSLNISLSFKKPDYSNINYIFNYIHDLIYDPIEQKNNLIHNDKLGIYLDDFKKIYLIDYKKLKFKPDIKEYEFNIYPKPNVHNLLETENFKNLLNSNYSLLSCIIYGCILSTILDDLTKANDNYYLFFFYIRISLLKILSLIKTGMKIPTDKSFYFIELKKNELNKIISDENIKKKENGFNINYLNSDSKEKNEKENSFNSIDKFGTLYKQEFYKKENLKTKSNINGFKTNDKNFMKFLREKKIKNRENNLGKGFLTKRQDMVISFNSNAIPDFSIYLTKEQKQKLQKVKLNKLPPLKFISKSKNQTTNSFLKKKFSKIDIKIKEINKMDDEIKIDISKYKEIKFQPTHKEKENE